MAVAAGNGEVVHLRAVGKGANSYVCHRGRYDNTVDRRAAVEGEIANGNQSFGQCDRGDVAAEAESHLVEMLHELWHRDGSRLPAGYDAERQTVLAVEPSVDGTVAGIGLVDRDTHQVPCPERALIILFKTGRQVQRRDAGVEEGVVVDAAQRVRQLQRRESAVIEAMRPDAANGWRQGETGHGGATLESNFAQCCHRVGGAVILHRLWNDDRAAVGSVVQIIVRQHFDGLLRGDAIDDTVRFKILSGSHGWQACRHQKGSEELNDAMFHCLYLFWLLNISALL